jgi:hypothetical protein
VATDELKLVIVLVNPDVVIAMLELKSLVVVATDEDKEPILDDNPLVVVATDEDKEPILELNPLVVVAIDELNVEYSVVPVILTCIEPEITPSSSNLDLIVVLMDEVKVFKLLVAVSIAVNLLFCVEFVESLELV